MSYYRSDDIGCTGLVVIICAGLALLFLVVKCSVSLVETVNHERAAHTSKTDSRLHEPDWTFFAVKDIDGKIVSDPKNPGFYYDSRQFCSSCMGSGKLPEGAVGRFLSDDDQCPRCYGTGRKRTPIPNYSKNH